MNITGGKNEADLLLAARCGASHNPFRYATRSFGNSLATLMDKV
jgi:hypothetical protein